MAGLRTLSASPAPAAPSLPPLDPAAAVAPADTADLWLRLEPGALCDRIETALEARFPRSVVTIHVEPAGAEAPAGAARA